MAFKAMTGITTEWFEPERYKVDKKTGELVELEGEFSDCTRIQIKPLSGANYVAAFGTESVITQRDMEDARKMCEEAAEEAESVCREANKLMNDVSRYC